MNNEFQIGVLVRSKSGRDNKKVYLVSKLLENGYCELVDGNAKTFTKPKKKNCKHLEPLGIKVEAIQNKLLNKLTVYDAEVYSAIKKNVNKGEV